MTTAFEGSEGSASRPGRSLPPGKTRYQLYRRLGGPQGRSGQVREISPPLGFDPRTVQPVASSYTDWATRPTQTMLNITQITHISPRPTPIPPHYPYVHFSSHPPPLINFPSPHLADLHTTSVPFVSFHLTLFLTFSLYTLDFPALQNPLTSLHFTSSHFSPFSWKYSIFSSLRIPSTSLHFTYHFQNPITKDARFGG